jgi:hypothetical protein
MHGVDRYRVTAAQQLATETRQMRRSFEPGNSRGRISHRRGPNPLFWQKQPRAESCSTGLARIDPFALRASNETGIRFAPCQFPLLPQRKHNGSLPRSTSRSQPQQLRSVQSRSYPSNSFHRASTQIFSCESMIGAIAAEGMLSGGTTSGIGPAEGGRMSGCSMRVAMSIAVKSNAPARK